MKSNIINKLEQLKKFHQNKEKTSHLVPIKHPHKDFFIADIFDSISFQSDLASMEHPLFALKAGDKRTRTYFNGNASIVVAPSADYGMATIHDKDIWIYCISKLMQAINDCEDISQTVNFTIYDYLITTNKATSGAQYQRTKEALERLRGTSITTNIETNNKRESNGFGLIDKWKIVEEKDGRMIRISVTLPDWLFRSVTSNNVLTISQDYFRLRKPLDRRVYEIARKHCGKQYKWEIGLDLLRKKSGSTSNLRLFRQAIKSLAQSDELPEYNVHYDNLTDKVFFKRRKQISNDNAYSLSLRAF